MIRRIEALGYRCLRDVSQWMAPFQVLVGPNASGKSTFLDCVGFLGDMLDVGPVAAILGNGSRGPRAADPRHLCWMQERTCFEIAIDLEVPSERLARLREPGKYSFARYEVAIDIGAAGTGITIAGENLFLTPRRDAEPQEHTLFPMPREPRDSIVRAPRTQTPSAWRKVVSKIAESGNDYFQAETSGWNNPFRLGPMKSALANLPEDEERFPVATCFAKDHTGATDIVLGSEHPRLRDWQGQLDLGVLFAAGVLG